MEWLQAVFAWLERLGYKPATAMFAPEASPGIQRMAEDLRARRYEALEAAFDRIPVDRYGDALDAILDALTGGKASQLPTALDAVRVWQDDPGKAAFHAAMLLARGSIREGWRVRGGRFAGDVREDAWPVFFGHLENADRLFDVARRLRPDHPEPCVGLLSTTRALEMDEAGTEARFRAVLAVAPLHLQGHVLMLENLKAKWGGSHEAMFAFAREHAGRAPDGHALGSLALYAHWEMRNLRYWDDDDDADAYFRQPEVARDIIQAWRRTAGAPAHVPDANSRVLHNLMAASLALCGQRELARQALQKMKGQCVEWPWCTMSESLPESVNPAWVVDRIARSVGMRP